MALIRHGSIRALQAYTQELLTCNMYFINVFVRLVHCARRQARTKSDFVSVTAWRGERVNAAMNGFNG